jgi:2-polyprenyl-3-methyl-5-hydroxy-6-metoxy-1,4-benzoquinol methylase
MRRPAYDQSWPESWKLSHQYDELEIGNSRQNPGYTYQYEIRRGWALRAIEELVPRGTYVLDVAGASGNFTLPLAENGYRVVWNDLRDDLAEMVRLKHERGEVEYAPGDIFSFREQWAERFDAVLATEIIEHVAHPDRFLVCLAGMLKPGGWLFVTTPNGRYFRNNLPRFSDCSDPSAYESVQFKPNSDGHIFLLDCEEMRALAANAGLTVERIQLATNPLTCGHVKLGYLLPYLPAVMVRALEATTQKFPRVMRERIHSQMVACLHKPE